MATTHYIGIERRTVQARQNPDHRRTTIRFEPSKDPRRSGKDRRNTSQSVWDKLNRL